MNKRSNALRKSADTSMACSGKTNLDDDVEFGLFEADNGDRYLVVADFEMKVAIALRHNCLPPLTWLGLHREPLDRGRWLGDCRLRLTHVLPQQYTGDQPGILGIGGCCSALICRSLVGETRWIALGRTGIEGSDFYDFNGWKLEAAASGSEFYTHRPNGGLRARTLKRPRVLMIRPDELT